MADPAEEMGGGAEEQLDDEQLRARLEEEIKRVRIEDVIAQSVASILNLAARRIVKEDEMDLEQGRVGIEAARALVEVLPEELQSAIRPALSELQMLYARQAGGGTPPEGAGQSGEQAPAGEAPGPPPGGPGQPPGGAQGPRPGGLWTPRGS